MSFKYPSSMYCALTTEYRHGHFVILSLMTHVEHTLSEYSYYHATLVLSNTFCRAQKAGRLKRNLL